MRSFGARSLGLCLGLLLLTAPMAASARTEASAARFVTGLYQAYLHGDPDYTGDRAADVFSARLLALIEQDADRTPEGDVPALDGDPICDCQDWEISRIRVRVSPKGRTRATAQVRFVNMKVPVSLRLDLVRQTSGWRVDDVHSANTPSLVRYLKDSLKDEPQG